MMFRWILCSLDIVTSSDDARVSTHCAQLHLCQLPLDTPRSKVMIQLRAEELNSSMGISEHGVQLKKEIYSRGDMLDLKFDSYSSYFCL